MFVWRSNLLGASGKGHEYFLKHLLGTKHGVMGKDLGQDGKKKPSDVVWHDQAPEGKLDLLVTLDFRMSTTCMYSDIVLPTASWYEKNDLNTSDMHPFIHPLTSAVDPVWEARNDWDIYKGIAKAFSAVAPEVLGVEKDVVLTPDHARLARRDRAAIRREGLEEGRDRSDPRQDHAVGDRGRARLSQPLQALHIARTADGQARQRRQGHELEYRARGRVPQEAQRRGDGGGGDQGSRPDRIQTSMPAKSSSASRRKPTARSLSRPGPRWKALPGANTRISPFQKRTKKSASATSSRSRARSFRRRSGRAWSRKRSATTPAIPTFTN